MSSASNSGVRLFDPQGLPPSVGFSQVAEVTPGKLLYLSGQVPRNAAGELIGPADFRAQLEQVFTNLGVALSGAGASFADVVKLNYYCVDSVEPAQQRAIVEVRDRFVNTQSPPASTFVFVSRLVRPDWLIEIEAVAVLPSAGSEVIVLAQVEVDQAHMQELIDLTRQMMADTLQEPGCLHYAFALDVAVATRLQLSERWRDDRALNAHLQGATLRRFRLALRKLQVRTLFVRRYEVARATDLVLPRLE
ncbi:MAG TPA: Rid family hydrolase [Steroidobacteraceae bacterium]|nr:Rid family hydrolase [Steroidobacteraceae bacterium]